MNQQPRTVSVVIPAYNAEQRIGEAIESVLGQSFPISELIVINDGSSDKTGEICRRYEDRIVYVDQPNRGVSATRNRGVEIAKSQWVAFLDADDTWLPYKIQMQIELLEQYPDLAWVAGRYLRCDSNREYVSKFGFDNVSGKYAVLDALEALANQTSIWTGTLLAKRDEFLELGGFDGDLKACEDFDLWVRMAIKNRQIGFINEPIARYTVDQASSLTGQSASQFNHTMLRFFEKRADEARLDDREDVRRQCQRILDEQIGLYLFNMLRVGNREGVQQLLAWLHDHQLPMPAIRYRWPMWVPAGLVRRMRTIWKRRRANNDDPIKSH